jgi:hypothetical protein
LFDSHSFLFNDFACYKFCYFIGGHVACGESVLFGLVYFVEVDDLYPVRKVLEGIAFEVVYFCF